MSNAIILRRANITYGSRIGDKWHSTAKFPCLLGLAPLGIHGRHGSTIKNRQRCQKCCVLQHMSGGNYSFWCKDKRHWADLPSLHGLPDISTISVVRIFFSSDIFSSLSKEGRRTALYYRRINSSHWGSKFEGARNVELNMWCYVPSFLPNGKPICLAGSELHWENWSPSCVAALQILEK